MTQENQGKNMYSLRDLVPMSHVLNDLSEKCYAKLSVDDCSGCCFFTDDVDKCRLWVIMKNFNESVRSFPEWMDFMLNQKIEKNEI